MTGYMLRNAEYVFALKELMGIPPAQNLKSYRSAFDKIDTDGSGYIELDEIYTLLASVYGSAEDVPKVELESFIKFFDKNNDGKVSWEEFESGLGKVKPNALNVDFDDLTKTDDKTPSVSGTVKVTDTDSSRFRVVKAQDYINNLKAEIAELQSAILSESSSPSIATGSLSAYISSLDKLDITTLTSSITPEVQAAMSMVTKYVMSGGPSGKPIPEEVQVEGKILKTLCLWQMICGYRLREEEVKGDFRDKLGR